MSKLVLLALILSTISYSVFAKTVVIQEAKVSCISYPSDSDDLFAEPEVELFFWDAKDAKEAKALFASGYVLKTYIMLNTMCGGYTPVIEVETRSRRKIKRAIRNAETVLEDGDKIWISDIGFELRD